MTGHTARTAALARTLAAGPADGDLLAAFLDHRDEAAFATLVRRHGPLVLSTCRHLLRDEAAAEDAFQATFVALVRKATRLRRCPSLAGWLFGAARNCARHLRRASDRRARRERRAAQPESVPAPDLSWRDACAALHAEIGRLPDVCRLPLVLCYLQGLSREEAAQRLGWSPDAVRGRLDRGRRCLRERLARRGVTLSAGLIAAVATDAVSPNLVRAAVACSVRPPARIAGVAAAAGPATLPMVAGLATAAAVLIGTVILTTGSGAPRAADPPAKDKPPEVVRSAVRMDAHGDPLPDGAVARLGTVRFNHGDGLHGLLFTPDGKEFVSVGNGVARVWDAATGAELRQFSTGRPDWDEQIALTPDGKRLVLVVQEFPEDSLRVYDLATGKLERSGTLAIRRGDQAVARPNALSADGSLVAVWSQKLVRVFDTATRKDLHTLPRPGESFQGLCFVGADLLATAAAQKIELWEARTGKPVREFELNGPAGVIAGSPDGKWLATLSHHTVEVDKFLDKDTVRLWNPATGKPGPELVSRPGRWFSRIGFSPDSKLVWAFAQSRDGGEVTVWDAATGARRAELPNAGGQVAALSPDGRRLAGGSNGGKFDVWDLATGKPTAPSELTSPWVGAVFLSRTGDRAVTLGRNTVTTWDTATGRPVSSPAVPEHLFEHNWCRFSPDGRYALTVQTTEKDGAVTLRDVAAVKPVHTIPITGPAYGAKGSFSPDSTRLALRLPGKDAPISVRDLNNWKELATIRPAANEYPDQFFFADDGRTLIVPGKRTVGYDLATGREAFGWNLDTEPTKTNMGIGVVGGGGVMMEADRRPWRSLVVSPDGSLAACTLDAGWGTDAKIPDRIVLCDARTGKAIRRWGDSGRQSRGYEKLAFSPDGRLLATSDGYDIHVWEVGTGKEVRALRGHRSEIETLAFSGNGRRIASASWDSTVLIWDVCPPAKNESSDPWADLVSADPAVGWASVGRLADDAAIALLRKHLQPFTAADSERITKLVASLDSDEFRSRDRAFKELVDLGHAALPALRTARDKKPSAEVADRLDQLLSKVIGPPSSGESLRTSRALAVLEAKGTSDARTLLKELAGGADGWLTTEAKAAMKRLDR